MSDSTGALVFVEIPSGSRIRVRTVGVFHMGDEKGTDEKLYKDLEPSKSTATRGWGNRSEAEKSLTAARERKGG